MTKVSMNTKLNVSAYEAWRLIGGFNALPDWHPAVEKSELTEEGQMRTLSLAGGGTIVNTASSAAISGIPGCTAYTAAKGATVALTRAMAVEYAPQKVRVNCIAPAGIYTPMIRESNLDDPSFNEEAFLKRTPLRRWGQPEDIANTALFLTSDDSAYITGSVITADGAITIMPAF